MRLFGYLHNNDHWMISNDQWSQPLARGCWFFAHENWRTDTVVQTETCSGADTSEHCVHCCTNWDLLTHLNAAFTVVQTENCWHTWTLLLLLYKLRTADTPECCVHCCTNWELLTHLNVAFTVVQTENCWHTRMLHSLLYKLRIADTPERCVHFASRLRCSQPTDVVFSV